MAKKEKPADEKIEPKPGSEVYFVANAGLLPADYIEFLRDKPYITLNGAFKKLKNFVQMAFSSQRVFENEKDGFWRIERADQDKFVIGSEETPIELVLMGEYEKAFFVGYDDIRFQAVKRAHEKAENIATQISKLVLN